MLISYGIIILIISAINCERLYSHQLEEDREKNERYCLNSPVSCKCHVTDDPYSAVYIVYSCSHDKSEQATKFAISFQEKYFLYLDCRSVSSFKIFPDLTNVINVTGIVVQNCKMPINESIYELTSKISKNVKHLAINFLKSERRTLKDRHFNVNKYLFEGLSKLETLAISGIHSVDSSVVFESLFNLKKLVLYDVSYEIPDGIFDTMNQLQCLSIRAGTLILPTGIFKNQKNLVELRLTCKLDSILNPLILANLPNLENFTIGGYCMISWPENMFKNSQKLKSFELQRTKLLVPQKILAPAHLTKFSLIECGISNLPEDLFKNSSNIEDLSLSSNKLKSLPNDIFVDQIMLRVLDLSFNGIMELSDGLFNTTLNMRNLSLTFNNLKSISRYVKSTNSKQYINNLHINRQLFAKLEKLETLSLSYNLLTTIDNSFRYLVNLKIIELQNNELSSTEGLFDYLKKLEKIYLSNNMINEFSLSNYTYNSNLQIIDLNGNNLQKFSYGDWMGWVNQLKIDLSYNKISEFEIKDYLLLSKIHGRQILLIVNHNPIICDCNALEFIQFVKKQMKPHDIYNTVDFNVNELKCHKPNQLYDRNVRSLSTSELICNIENDCPDGCQCQQRPVDNTLIFKCSILQEFPSLSKYTNLNLTNTELTYRLANNESHKIMLKNIPDDLKQLDLRNNSLQSLDNIIIDRFKGIDKLFLSGNSWTCNCDTAEIVNFYHVFRSQIIDADDMMCADGRPFNSVVAKDLCRKLQKIEIFVVFLMGTSLLGIFSTTYVIFRKEIKMWLYAHNCCLWWVSEEEADKDKIYDAFFIFSHLDNNFVTDLILDLELPPKSYKCCVHHRDWPAGEMIITLVSH